MAVAGIIALPTGQRPQLVWRGPDPAALTDDQRARIEQVVDRVGGDVLPGGSVTLVVTADVGPLVGTVVRATLAGASALAVTDLASATSVRRTLETLAHIDRARTRP